MHWSFLSEGFQMMPVRYLNIPFLFYYERRLCNFYASSRQVSWLSWHHYIHACYTSVAHFFSISTSYILRHSLFAWLQNHSYQSFVYMRVVNILLYIWSSAWFLSIVSSLFISKTWVFFCHQLFFFSFLTSYGRI